MKKLKLTVAALMAVCALTAASCSDKEKAAEAAAVVPGDNSAINVRYLNSDSVFSNYVLARELMAELERAGQQFESQVNTRRSQLQQRVNTYAQKRQNNIYMTEASRQKDQNEIQAADEANQRWFAQRQGELQNYQLSVAARMQDSLRAVVKDICAKYNFQVVQDVAVTYYVDPALDITDMVIKMLNDRYQPASATAAPEAPAAPAAAAAPAAK